MLANENFRAPLLIIAMVAIAGAVFAFDSHIPAGLGGGVPYSACVVLALWLPWRHSNIAVALACSALNAGALHLAASAELDWVILASRSCGWAAIWAAAFAGQHQRDVGHALEDRVEKRTGELSLANAALQREVARRERADAELHQREAFLELAIDTASAVVILLGRDCEILEWNHEAELVFGASKEEVLGIDYFDRFVPPGRVEAVKAIYKQMLESGDQVRSAEAPILTGGGEKREMIWSGVATHDTQGAALGVLGVGIDITERKRTEREREERLRFEEFLVDLSAEFVRSTATELDRSIGYGLRRLGELMGVDRCTIDLFAEEPGLLPHGFVWLSEEHGEYRAPESDRAKLLAKMPWLEEHLRSGRELILGDPSGVPKEASDLNELAGRYGIRSAALIPMLVDGKPIGCLSMSVLKGRRREWPDPLIKRLRLAAEIIANALVRRRTEQLLRSVTEETRSILETAVDAVITVGADGTVESLNPAAEMMFGYAPNEIIGRSILTLTAPDDKPQHSALIHEYAATGEITHLQDGGREIVGLRKDGSSFPLFFTTSAATTSGGNRRLTVFGRDLSREKAMEERLRAAATEAALAEQRERKVLARDLHDGLGQLLSLASMKLGALRGASEDAEVQTRIRQIEDVIGEADRRTTSLTFQLSPPVLDDVGLVAAAQWLAEDLERIYGLRVLVAHGREPTGLDEAGRVSLFRALRELLINVAKHAEVDAAKVSIHSENQRVIVRVEDRGCGFDPDQERGGYGLLSLRERVEHMGGTLKIESAPGEGTRIVVTAPESRVAEAEREEPA
ncbi:MAG: PAS domain S-box protein [Deltaproteobacteria bacterium]|nr:PAS domain S-box protein [Deltaproteobacteria bacterium]